jgi:hypothetical protein
MESKQKLKAKDRQDKLKYHILDFYFKYRSYPSISTVLQSMVLSGEKTEFLIEDIRTMKDRGEIIFRPPNSINLADLECRWTRQELLAEECLALPEIEHPEFGSVVILTKVD